MQNILKTFKNSITSSVQIMRDSAVELIADATDCKNHLPDDERIYRYEASLQLSTYAAGLIMAGHFFDIAYKDDRFDIWDLCHAQKYALRKPLDDNKEALAENLFEGHSYRETLKSILKNTSAVYNEQYMDLRDGDMPEMISERINNLHAGYYLMKIAHKAPIIDGIEYLEKDSAFYTACDIEKLRMNPHNTAAQKCELENEFSVVQSFFENNDFKNFYTDNYVLNYDPVGLDIAKWAGAQYLVSRDLYFPSLN